MDLGSNGYILKGDHPRTIPSKFGPNLPSSYRQEDFSLFFPIRSYVKTMLADGSRLGWTSGPTDTIMTIQGPFRQSLVPIGQEVSEKKIFYHLFAEFSIFNHDGHLSWRVGPWDTILKFGPNWHSGFKGEV